MKSSENLNRIGKKPEESVTLESTLPVRPVGESSLSEERAMRVASIFNLGLRVLPSPAATASDPPAPQEGEGKTDCPGWMRRFASKSMTRHESG